MERLIERVLERACLTEEDLSSCGSVNLPEAGQPHLDLTPAQIVAALRAGDLDKLAESKSVWVSGWEPSEHLRRLLAAVRGVLNARPTPPAAGRFYRHIGEQLKSQGRVSHARLLSWSESGEEAPTSVEQRLALRMRGKIRGRVAPAGNPEDLREQLSGGVDESS